MFDHVIAFEPAPPHIECFKVNIKSENVELHEVALGDHDATMGMRVRLKHSMGSMMITGDGDIRVEVKRLDEFEIVNVDFLKIDVKGFRSPGCPRRREDDPRFSPNDRYRTEARQCRAARFWPV